MKGKLITDAAYFEKNHFEFWDSLNEGSRELLKQTVKSKLGLERTFVDKFTKRYFYERTQFTLTTADFAFGDYGFFGNAFHRLFLKNVKEKKFIVPIVRHELERLNSEFEKIVTKMRLDHFNEALNIYRIEINSLSDPLDYGILLKKLHNEDLVEFSTKVLSAEAFALPPEEKKNYVFNMLVRNDAYKTDQLFSGFVLYSVEKKEGYIYFDAESISVKDFQFIGLYRFLLFKKFGIKDTKLFFVTDKGDFRIMKSMIREFMKKSVKIVKLIQDEGLKKWLVNSLNNPKVGDFSLYISEDESFFKYESLFEGKYKTMMNIEHCNRGKLSEDIKNTLGVRIEGEETTGRFKIGQCEYRINVMQSVGFSLSIRKLNRVFYSITDLEKNGIDESWLFVKERDLWNVNYKLLENQWSPGKSLTLLDFLREDDVAKIRREMDKSLGASFVVWPTGSGKSTLYKIVLDEYYEKSLAGGENKKIVFFEDPVEETNPNFYQFGFEGADKESGRKGNLIKLIKGTKRTAPNLVLVGETRDQETLKEVLLLSELQQTATTQHKGDIKMWVQSYVQDTKMEDYEVTPYEALTRINFAIVIRRFQDNIDWTKVEDTGDIKFKSKEAVKQDINQIFLGKVPMNRISNLVEKSRQIRLVDWGKTPHQFVGSEIKNQVVYERMFSDDFDNFLDKFYGGETLLDRQKVINDLGKIYSVIGWHTSFAYQFIYHFLRGEINRGATANTKIEISKYIGRMTEDEAKDMFGILETELTKDSINQITKQ